MKTPLSNGIKYGGGGTKHTHTQPPTTTTQFTLEKNDNACLHYTESISVKMGIKGET